MRYYTQFLTRDLAGNIVEAIASDGVFILDGRNSLDNMINDSYEHMTSLSIVQPRYMGFMIMRGSRFDDSNHAIYRTHIPYAH